MNLTAGGSKQTRNFNFERPMPGDCTSNNCLREKVLIKIKTRLHKPKNHYVTDYTIPQHGGSSSSWDLQAFRSPAASGNFAGGIPRRDQARSST